MRLHLARSLQDRLRLVAKFTNTTKHGADEKTGSAKLALFVCGCLFFSISKKIPQNAWMCRIKFVILPALTSFIHLNLNAYERTNNKIVW